MFFGNEPCRNNLISLPRGARNARLPAAFAIIAAPLSAAIFVPHAANRIGTINPAWEAKILKIGAMPHQQRMALIKSKFFAYVPCAMFCIMPLFALYLKLLCLRSGRTYGEHMLFALHSNAFAFLLLGLIWAVPGGWTDAALFAWLLAYLPFAMRRVYGGSKLATAARWILLMTAYMVTAAAVVVGTLFSATVMLRRRGGAWLAEKRRRPLYCSGIQCTADYTSLPFLG